MVHSDTQRNRVTNQFLEFVDFDEFQSVLEESQRPFINTPHGKCLFHLLKKIGWNGSIRDLSQALPHHPDHELSHIHIINTMVNLGYTPHILHDSLKNLSSHLLPCLYTSYTDKYAAHPMVLLEKQDDSYEIYDSDSDKITQKLIGRREKGEIYSFPQNTSQYSQTTPTPLEKESLSAWIFRVLARFNPLIKHILILSFFANALSIVTSFFLKMVYDKVIAVADYTILFFMSIGMALVLYFDDIFKEIRLKAISWIGVRLDHIYSLLIYERLVLLPVRLADISSVSTQISRLRDFDSIREFITSPIMLSLIDLPFFILFLSAAAVINVKMVIIPLIFSLLYFIFFFSLRSSVNHKLDKTAFEHVKRQNLIFESLSHVEAIKSTNVHHTWEKQFHKISSSAAIGSLHSGYIISIIETISYILYISAGISTLTLGITLVINEQLSLGGLMACMILIWRALVPLQACLNSMSVLLHFEKSLTQVYKLFQINLNEKLSTLPVADIESGNSIKFDRVYLKHPNNSTPTFSGLTLEISNPDLLLVYGKGGSGKSSFLKLISNFYQPTAGAVLINDIDARQLSLATINGKINCVPDEHYLFYGTILQNIKITNPTIKDEEIINLVYKLEIQQHIPDIHAWLHYRLKDENIHQIHPFIAFLICFLRAIITFPSILLIDTPPPGFLQSHLGNCFLEFLTQWRLNRIVIIATSMSKDLSITEKVLYLTSDGRGVIGHPHDILKMHASLN